MAMIISLYLISSGADTGQVILFDIIVRALRQLLDQIATYLLSNSSDQEDPILKQAAAVHFRGLDASL